MDKTPISRKVGWHLISVIVVVSWGDDSTTFRFFTYLYLLVGVKNPSYLGAISLMPLRLRRKHGVENIVAAQPRL